MKTILNFWLLNVIAIFVLTSCTNKKEKATSVQLKDSAIQKISQKNNELHELTQASCLYCHRIDNAQEENELAPKMQVVIDVYKAQYPNKEDFIKAIVAYSVNPDPKNTLMQGAIELYKPMPNSGIVEADAMDIARYLYDYKF
jgi:hypothetical protein